MDLTIHDLHNDIINEILYHYLNLDDIRTCLLASKLFNVLTNYQINIRKLTTNRFCWCLVYGHLEACKWFNECYYICVDYVDTSNWFINTYIPDICRYSNLKTIKWYYQLCKEKNIHIDIHYDNDNAFNKACRTGNLDIIKWLYDLSNEQCIQIDIHRHEEDAFAWCCSEGHFETAKWLWEISVKINSPINIHIDNTEQAFRFCCGNSNLNMVKWLYNLAIKIGSPINFEVVKYQAFYLACEKGCLDILKWLYELNIKINSRINIIIFKSGFEIAVTYNQLEVAKWILDLSIDMGNINILDDIELYYKIIDSWVSDEAKQNTVKWFKKKRKIWLEDNEHINKKQKVDK